MGYLQFCDNVAVSFSSYCYLTPSSGVSSPSLQGQNTKANGDGSHAQGGTTIASGIYLRSGNATTASGCFHTQGQYSLVVRWCFMLRVIQQLPVVIFTC
jgi:hypothetical protein